MINQNQTQRPKTRGVPVTLEQLAQEDQARGNQRQYARVVRAAKRGN